MEGEQQIALAGGDDFIASITINSSENRQNVDESLMSDNDFAQELQLQEVIISSLINLQKLPPVNVSKKVEIGEPSKLAVAESEANGGDSSQSLCEICAEKKDKDSMFPLHNCSHKFCNECISRHISIKIQTSGQSSSTPRSPTNGRLLFCQ